MRIHQILSGAGPHDAVTTQAFAFRALFGAWGWEGSDVAAEIDPRVGSQIAPLRSLDTAPGDVLLIHYSAYAPRLVSLLEAPQRKLLVYHNITPARYLWEHSPHVATACALGRDHLPRYARAADVAVGVSRYNALELERAGAPAARVVPLLFDVARLEARGAAPAVGPGPLVLVVGRLVPNKRPDQAIRAFALYQRHCAPEATLMCVGEPTSAEYTEKLAGLAREVGARNVLLTGPLPQPDLNAAYERADVMLSLSEHEGFCLPLLEAFHFGVPVVARPAGAMPEVGGDAVLWADDPDLAVVSELIDLAVRDAELRQALDGRARARLEHYAYDRVARALRETVEEAIGQGSATRVSA